MRDFVFVTGNQKKLEQVEHVLGCKVERKKIDLDEIQSLQVREVSEHKARQAFRMLDGRPVLTEDTSLEVQSLNGLPGPLIKWFLKALDHAQICSLVSGDRSAVYVNSFAYYAGGDDVHHFTGVVPGYIVKEPRGAGGMGFDALFVHQGMTKTRAEMTDIERAETSGRAIALRQFREFLEAK